MPETFKGLYKQRLRWAIGGQALKTYFGSLFSWRMRRMWGVMLEYLASIVWSYSMLALLCIWAYVLAEHAYYGNLNDLYFEILPQWQGAMLAFTCLLQFGVSIFIDKRYDYGLWKIYLDIIWYPLFYWTLNWVVTFMAFPKAMLRKKSESGLWVTTDRGVSKN